MRRGLFFIILLLNIHIAFSQSSLSGKIIDKADNKPLVNASIVILNQDSILKHFTRANEDGRFEIKNIQHGSYIMLVTYPKFEVISKEIKIEDKDLRLGDLPVNSQMNVIEEVLVTQRIPIKLKGDTIEYDAASFETEKNAKLEDLLRRLPGLSVSADGKITAQGKSVSKVLIDGEEFFGYDPKIAIRNIRADAVNKVQVYERKSEESELTGIDDGVRLQTVNVITKEEARVGIFGNTELLYGTENLYTGNLFTAKFNHSERIGVTANVNNMGQSGREGDLRMNNQIIGNPFNSSVGANYENKFFKQRLNVNGNYNFNTNSLKNEGESFNKEVISDTEIQETRSNSSSDNSNQSNNIRSDFRIRIDSTQNMNVQIRGNISKRENTSTSSSETVNESQSLINDFESERSSITNANSNDIRLNYRKQLNKNGASLNFHLNNGYSKDETINNVIENANFYLKDSTNNIHQQRVGESKSNNFSTQLNFSNNFNKHINYSIGYTYNNNNRKNFNDAFNIKDGKLVNIIDTTYSQHQIDRSDNQGINTALMFNFESIFINITNRVLYKQQTLEDTYRSIDLSRNFWDNNLNMDMNFRITSRKNLRATFQNSYIIPTFDQLQPLQPQTNALFIQKGNPDLKRSINNTIGLNYNTVSLLKGTRMNINSSISFVNDPIVNKREIDQDRVTTSSFVNVTDRSSWNANLNGNFNKSVFNKQVQLTVFSSASYNNGFSFIRYNNATNYELNNLQNTNGNIGVGINEQNSQGLDFDINASIGINNQKNSLQKDFNYTNMMGSGSAFMKYFLPRQFNISTNLVYAYEGPTRFYPRSIHQFYTNMALNKKLLKDQSLEASIKAFDVFNTFNNINRSSSETGFSQSTQQMLTRYVMLGLKWDFNKYLGKKKDD